MANTTRKIISCIIVLILLILTQLGVFRVDLADAPKVDKLYGGKYIYLTLCGSLAVIICTTLYLFRFYGILSIVTHTVATMQMTIFLSFWLLFFFKRISLYTKDEIKNMHAGLMGIIRQCPRHLIPFLVISCYLIEIDRPSTKFDYVLSLSLSILYCFWVRHTFTKNNIYPYPFLKNFKNPLLMYTFFVVFVTVFFILTMMYNELLRCLHKRIYNRHNKNKTAHHD